MAVFAFAEMNSCLGASLRIRPRWFNFFLGSLALLLLAGGCASTSEGDTEKKKKKDASTLRLHLEANDDGGFGTGKIEVLRSHPMKVVVAKEPFLDEGMIKEARVVDVPGGGFMISVQYTTQGEMRLDMNTTSSLSKRVAVWSRWTTGRWLAAPIITQPVQNGVFTFTPDCTREEADRIVRGLNNIAVELKNQEDPDKVRKAQEKARKAAEKNGEKPVDQFLDEKK